MADVVKASVIICTHNHLASLRETVRAFRTLRIPNGVEVEILFVENACTDGTAEFVEAISIPGMQCRPLHEPRKGQVRARNLGLSFAQGDSIVFTDDDVRPNADWLERLIGRLQDGSSDALIGAVKLAPHLERPWMDRRHRARLAASEGLDDGWLTEMIGANMAFHRRVLRRVPRFDEELGPGALGFGDDTLFSWQVERAGFRIGRAPDALVEHHCDADRLLRSRYLEAAKRNGQSQAYLMYHWSHAPLKFPLLRIAMAQIKFARRRLISARDTRREEGCAEWELSLVREIAKCRQYLLECRRPRNYEQFGLVKLRS